MGLSLFRRPLHWRFCLCAVAGQETGVRSRRAPPAERGLIMLDAAKEKVDAHTGKTTTGHEWDGIAELNTPLPRWWLWTFYATIAWAFLYWIAYPAWPLLTGATS